ncbi:cupin domain-containing protein [Streptomyces sp. NPDC056149]|uniref:cupin domain-containing protein n=1 Tax=unclassified Streptomyces TaxID=2593676 RepID=UPI002380FECE|nr:cupin domain-containing protein [Streptomyces sp. WZ-12]
MTTTDLDPKSPVPGPGSTTGASGLAAGSGDVAPASFVVNVPGLADAELEPEPLDPEQVVSGDPVVTGKVLWESPDGCQIRGIWQITPGVVTDTEANELFVVVSGRATIEVEGGPVLEVGPGDACVLREGDRTRWTVHETLRKAYHISL